MDYVQHKIQGLTQSKMSSVPLFGVPRERQLCFDAYRANIDAFIYATSKKTKVIASAEEFPIYEHVHALPLSCPRVAFVPEDALNAEQIRIMTNRLSQYGFESHSASKNTRLYTLDRPVFNVIENVIIHLARPGIVTSEGTCTAEAAIASKKLYQIIDLFLATNTYPYTRERGHVDADIAMVDASFYRVSGQDDEGDEDDEDADMDLVSTT